MRKLYEEHKLTSEAIEAIMLEEKGNQREKTVVRGENLSSLVPPDLPETERESYILKALEFYAKHRNRQRGGDVRLVNEPSLYSTEKIESPKDALRVIAEELKTYDREVFAILSLKTSGYPIALQPISMSIASKGDLESAIVSPRDIFKTLVLQNCHSYIAIHNHPGQISDIRPSSEDREVTKRLLACSELMGIPMLDHVIVGAESGEMFSFQEHGLLDILKPRHKAWDLER